jgi:glycosyltransferase involved in cell wall biosynthesis
MRRSASIVITNYNYGRFLKQAIESTLRQSHAPAEVVVVDDGSTDESRDVIARHSGDVRAVLKANGGQASAFNAGFAETRGDVVLFLDADDALLPHAVETVLPYFDEPEVVKVHWPLAVIDRDGRRTGRTTPGGRLADGDRRQQAMRLGPTNLVSAPTSGNAWARSLLEQLLPIPEEVYRICADTYLFESAPFYGTLRALPEPLALYRDHGRNSYAALSHQARQRRELAIYDECAARLARYCRSRGVEAEVDRWRRHSWWHRQHQAAEELRAVIDTGATFVFVDGMTWNLDELGDGRCPLPFVERNGTYWGPPADDATAIAELHRMRQAGARYIVFAWTCFWWLQHYAGFHRHLRRFECLLENERLLVFRLSESQAHVA